MGEEAVNNRCDQLVPRKFVVCSGINFGGSRFFFDGKRLFE